jgi:hypothetical protein
VASSSIARREVRGKERVTRNALDSTRAQHDVVRPEARPCLGWGSDAVVRTSDTDAYAYAYADAYSYSFAAVTAAFSHASRHQQQVAAAPPPLPSAYSVGGG